MKVAIATVQVPFISGGAEIMTEGLHAALLRAGHQVEKVALPFRFGPPSAVLSNMDAWAREDFNRFDSGPIDTVLALKFPAFYLHHPNTRIWLMHQHRSVYELWDTPYGDGPANPEAVALREQVVRRDSEALARARHIFTISQTVSDRLQHYNRVASRPLHQPPAHAELYFDGPAMPYVFVPSRLETLKRQELLIRAMAHVPEPLFAAIAGEGGQRQHLERVVAELGLERRVRFLGRLDDADMRRWYAHATAVFFGPLLEDYGFITLEAMLSSRPVITCRDSGGPVHFVRHGETGLVTDPSPEAVAQAIASLSADPGRARELGRNGRAHYDALKISWDHVVATLLAD